MSDFLAGLVAILAGVIIWHSYAIELYGRKLLSLELEIKAIGRKDGDA